MKLKLSHKLLIALFACAALVLVLTTLVTRASIGRGFMDFLLQQERSQVELVVPVLANWYGEHGSWDGLSANPPEFYGLVFNALPQRIFLLDADFVPVIGEVPPGIPRDMLLAIEVNGAKAGWLGFAMIRDIELPAEEAFIRQLRNNLLIGLVLGLAVAAVLAWLLARHLSRPVNQMAAGLRALAAGDYNQRLQNRGSDEIARLGEDVNRLATALGEHESAVLRRTNPADSGTPPAGLQIDAERHSASINGKQLKLSPVEFALFSRFAAHPGRVYSRDQLMSTIYSDCRIVSDRTVDTHVKNLRRKLEDCGCSHDLIESVYGVGYRLST